MTPDELISVIATCHQAGVRSIKTADFTIKFGPAKPKPAAAGPPIPVQPAPELTPEQQQKIEHKIEEMESAMKLGDGDLLERMFPLPKASDGQEEVE